MQERLELIFNLFPLGPQVDHNIKECSPCQHNPGRNVGVWVSCGGRDFTVNALICTNRINIIAVCQTDIDSTLYPSSSSVSIQNSFIFLQSPVWQSRIKRGINLCPSHLIQLQNNAGRLGSATLTGALYQCNTNTLTRSHCESLCDYSGFFIIASPRHTEGGLNWRLPSQIINTNQSNATSSVTVPSAILA